MNVGQFRAATEGLPDDAPVVLHIHEGDDSEGSAFIQLVGLMADGRGLAIQLLAIVAGPFDVADEDWSDDDDDDD